MGVRLGLDTRLFRNSSSYDTPSWQEMKNVKDLTLNVEAGEADASTRGNGGWRAILATLKDGSIEFAALDGDVATAGSQGLRATMAITNFSRNEPLEEAITVSVTAKPTYAEHPPEWMTTT